MDIYQRLESLAKGWKTVVDSGDEVSFKDKKYSKPKNEEGWRSLASEVMTELWPELKFCMNPEYSMLELMGKTDAEAPENWDKYLLIDAAVSAGIYQEGSVVRDGSKLRNFHYFMYKKFFPDYLVPLLTEITPDDVDKAFSYLQSNFAKYEQTHIDVLSSISEKWKPDNMNEPEKVFDEFIKSDSYFQTFKKFGAFSNPFYFRVRQVFKHTSPPFNEDNYAALADTVLFELIRYGFWFRSKEKEYISSLKENPERLKNIGINPQILEFIDEDPAGVNLYEVPLFPERQVTEHYMKVLELLELFGFVVKRLGTQFGDCNYMYQMVTIPSSGGDMSESFEVSPASLKDESSYIEVVLKHLDRVAPPEIFPRFNPVMHSVIKGLNDI